MSTEQGCVRCESEEFGPISSACTKFFCFQVYIKSDAAYIIFNILFSVSNGYINSICLMHGPKTLNNPQDQSRAASILVFFLMLGLTVGSVMSAPILHLV